MKFELNKHYYTTLSDHLLKCTSEWQAPRPNGKKHMGIDFSKSGNVGILSATDGIVDHVGWDSSSNGGFGLYIKVKIGTGKYLFYGHLKNVTVIDNEKVLKNDRIGTMGNTGNSTGQHIHFEYRENNVAKDPTKFLIVNNMNEEQKELINFTKKKWSPLMDNMSDQQILDWIKKDGREIVRDVLGYIPEELYTKNITKVILDNKEIFGRYFRKTFV